MTSKFIFRFKKWFWFYLMQNVLITTRTNMCWCESMFPTQLNFLANYQEKFRKLLLTLPSRNLQLSGPVRSFPLSSGFWLFYWGLLSFPSSWSWLTWWSVGSVRAGGSPPICSASPGTDFWSTLWASAFKFWLWLLQRNKFCTLLLRVHSTCTKLA